MDKPNLFQYWESNQGVKMMPLKGGERIFSRIDTKKIRALAKGSKDDKDLEKLGRYVAGALEKQDKRPNLTKN